MDFRLYCQNRESSSRIFSIPNPGMGGCDLIPPIQTRFSAKDKNAESGAMFFLPLEALSFGFPYQRLDKCQWVCRVTVWGTAMQSCFGFFILFMAVPSFRGIPWIKGTFMPLLGKPERLSRKKNMSRPGALQILRKTSDSELGGIHFAHFPVDKGY